MSFIFSHCSSRIFTTSLWPFLAARCNAVFPSLTLKCQIRSFKTHNKVKTSSKNNRRPLVFYILLSYTQGGGISMQRVQRFRLSWNGHFHIHTDMTFLVYLLVSNSVNCGVWPVKRPKILLTAEESMKRKTLGTGSYKDGDYTKPWSLLKFNGQNLSKHIETCSGFKDNITIFSLLLLHHQHKFSVAN